MDPSCSTPAPFTQSAGPFSPNSRNEPITLPDGQVELRVKVDRRLFEALINGDDAEAFFKEIMKKSHTEISWPPRLKSNTKSKKDPHIRVIGTPEDVDQAKELILAHLDTRRSRITLKMDVAFTDHSHIIGKGGRSIQKVMDETGCHIHFPDSNRTNTTEKSNQVSIAGCALGAEQARCRIRELLPLTFAFDVPVNAILSQALDPASVVIPTIQNNYGVNIGIRYPARSSPLFSSYGVSQSYGNYLTVSVRGTRSHLQGVRQAMATLLEQLTGATLTLASLPLTLCIEIAAQHHAFVMGRGNCNIRLIAQQTGAVITFPDVLPTDAVSSAASLPSRKSTVTIKGPSFDSVLYAWQELLGYLPLVLIFDLREGQELDAAQVTLMMDQLKVSILIKPKQKQNLKSIMVRGPEKDSRVLFEVRRQILGLDQAEVPYCCDRHYWSLFSKILSSLLPGSLPQSTPLPHLAFGKGTPLPNPYLGMQSGYSGLQQNYGDPMMSSGNALLYQGLLSQQLASQQKMGSQDSHQYKTSFEDIKSMDKLGYQNDAYDFITSAMTPSLTPNTSGTNTPDVIPTSPMVPTVQEFADTTFINSFDKKQPDREYMVHKLIRGQIHNPNQVRTPTEIWKGLGKSLPVNVFRDILSAEAKQRREQEGVDSGSSKFWDISTSPPTVSSLLLNPRPTYRGSRGGRAFSRSNYFEDYVLRHNSPTHTVSAAPTSDPEPAKGLELPALLSNMGLSRFLIHFENMSFNDFIKLTEQDLFEMRIMFNDRIKIRTAIADLRRLFRPDDFSPLSGHFEAAPGAERFRNLK